YVFIHILALSLAAHDCDAVCLRLVSLLSRLAILVLLQVVGSHHAQRFLHGNFFSRAEIDPQRKRQFQVLHPTISESSSQPCVLRKRMGHDHEKFYGWKESSTLFLTVSTC